MESELAMVADPKSGMETYTSAGDMPKVEAEGTQGRLDSVGLGYQFVCQCNIFIGRM